MGSPEAEFSLLVLAVGSPDFAGTASLLMRHTPLPTASQASLFASLSAGNRSLVTLDLTGADVAGAAVDGSLDAPQGAAHLGSAGGRGLASWLKNHQVRER